VICAITLGVVGLIVFTLWEIYAPLKEPLIPMHLFKNMEWTSSVILLGLGAGIYYAFSIVWPSQVAVLYGKPNDTMYTGYLSVIIGCGFIVGQTAAGLLAKQIGRQKWQIRIMFLVGGVFLACKLCHCYLDTKSS
jgi:MFS family permease